jgi:hypothetical protein
MTDRKIAIRVRNLGKKYTIGGLAKIPSDGIPYPLFVLAALLPWTLHECEEEREPPSSDPRCKISRARYRWLKGVRRNTASGPQQRTCPRGG